MGPTTTSASDSSCPAGLAGKFVTGWYMDEPAFQWYKFFGEHTFAATDTLTLSFAVVPFGSGQTLIALDEDDGRTGFALHFYKGAVYGTDHGNEFADDTPLAAYNIGAWNTVQADYDFASHQYTLVVNGTDTGPFPFSFDDSNSVQSLRIHSYDANSETFAWFDSISVVKSSGGNQTGLFTATFDNGASYSASYGGTITALEPPAGYVLPVACTSEPMLVVSPTYLEFSDEGGSNPPSQFISIGDNDAGPLSWTAEKSIGWLSLSSTGGTTPAQIEVSVNTDGLGPGVYAAEITVSSDDVKRGSSQTVYVSLIVRSGSAPISGPCPRNLAGKFVTGWYMDEPAFQWYKFFGEHTFAATDTLTLSFAVVPFGSGQTLIALDEVGGRTGFALHFYKGTVYDADHGNEFADDTPLAAYNIGAWNTVQADYDFASHQYTLVVNGTDTGPFPFSFDDSNSVQSLRIHSHDANSETFAWFDSISVVKSSGGNQTGLFTATFDDGASYSPSYGGTITALEPPGGYEVPVCKKSGSWLDVSPGVLSFSAFEGDRNPDPQFVVIDGDSMGPISWTAGESVSWLSMSSAQGTTPATVEVSVDISDLDPGEYLGPVTIVSSQVPDDPQMVDVRLLISPSADIALSAQPGLDNIRLDWNATNNPQVTAYRILRAVSPSQDFTEIATAGDTTYRDADPTLASGTEYCYYVAALRLDGSLVQESNVACTVFGQIELWVPDTWAEPGEMMVVPVNIRNATGLSIAAGDIWLNFDGTVIEVVDISETPLTDSYAWSYAIQSTETYSQARISAFGSPTLLHGSGSLFWLTVRVLGSEGAESPLDLQEFVDGVGGTAIYTPDDLFNPIPTHLQDAVFHVADGCALGDLNGNGVVQAVDAFMALQIASGEITPSADEMLAGDDNGNGGIEAADASKILYYATHGAWPMPSQGGTVAEHDIVDLEGPVVLSLDDVRGEPGEVVQTTLRAENLSDWAGGEFLIVYDPGVVDGIVNVKAAGLSSGFAVQFHDDKAGMLRIALADGAPISGSGVLATISLRIPSVPFTIGSTPLNLAEAHLNDVAGRDLATSALQQTVERHSGVLEVDFDHCYFPFVAK